MAMRKNWFRYCGAVAGWDRSMQAHRSWLEALLVYVGRLATYVAEVADPDTERKLEESLVEAQQVGALDKETVEVITCLLNEVRAKERPEPDPEVRRPCRAPIEWTQETHAAAFMAAWEAKSASDADYATCPKRDESLQLLDEGVEHRAITREYADTLWPKFEEAWDKGRDERSSRVAALS